MYSQLFSPSKYSSNNFNNFIDLSFFSCQEMTDIQVINFTENLNPLKNLNNLSLSLILYIFIGTSIYLIVFLVVKNLQKTDS